MSSTLAERYHKDAENMSTQTQGHGSQDGGFKPVATEPEVEKKEESMEAASTLGQKAKAESTEKVEEKSAGEAAEAKPAEDEPADDASAKEIPADTEKTEPDEGAAEADHAAASEGTGKRTYPEVPLPTPSLNSKIASECANKTWEEYNAIPVAPNGKKDEKALKAWHKEKRAEVTAMQEHSKRLKVETLAAGQNLVDHCGKTSMFLGVLASIGVVHKKMEEATGEKMEEIGVVHKKMEEAQRREEAKSVAAEAFQRRVQAFLTELQSNVELEAAP